MQQRSKKAAIVLNAPFLDVPIEEKDVICADGGRNLVVDSFMPVAMVGDFDSYVGMEPSRAGEVVVCPTIKDYTDGERAVEFAAEKGYEEIVLYGIKGGRSDHVYANLSLLVLAKEKGLIAYAKSKGERIYFYTEEDGRVEIEAKEGDIVSVLPYDGNAVVDASDGLFYPYNTLALTRTRAVGISNVVVSAPASFIIRKGSVLVFVTEKEKA